MCAVLKPYDAESVIGCKHKDISVGKNIATESEM
jgi:hypothetical protein